MRKLVCWLLGHDWGEWHNIVYLGPAAVDIEITIALRQVVDLFRGDLWLEGRCCGRCGKSETRNHRVWKDETAEEGEAE